MRYGLSHARSSKCTHQMPARSRITQHVQDRAVRGEKMEEVNTQAPAPLERLEAVAAHPLAELLDCPPTTGNLLSGSAQCIAFDDGEVVFRQNEPCKGLYVVVSGLFVRKAERLKTRVTLGPARAGDLVELAAALGDGLHTFTLSAQSAGSVLMLPIEALNQVFESYPPLRMRLLEELAREVSRAYISCCMSRAVPTRRRSAVAEQA